MTGFSGGAQFSKGVSSSDSIELVAAATSDQSGAFTGWAGATSGDTFNPVGYTPPDSRTICVPGNFTGNRTYVASYGAANSAPLAASRTAAVSTATLALAPCCRIARR